MSITDSLVLNRETNTITIANFWESYLLNKYDFDPAYQRKSVWSDEKQSFFIDSIFKNFPIPPIFLHQKIDDAVGKTTYDIIDGKQRLTSIIRFINNEIPISSELETQFYDERIAGVYFKDLDKRELIDYKKRFWRYVIPIEYIDTSNKTIIDNIFDRLNRNGEPLTGQELRKSKYHDSALLKAIEEFAEWPYWKDRLKNTDVSRMEHYEFISELFFELIEKKPLHANQEEIDALYEKYSRTDSLDWVSLKEEFITLTKYLESLKLNYDRYKIGGVSHLYGLWCFSHKAWNAKMNPEDLSAMLEVFFEALRSPEISNEFVKQYKLSMSSRTKDQGQRQRRLDSLWSFVAIKQG